MKLILYSFQDKEAEKIKEFLQNNNLPFKEIIINKENLNEIRKLSYQDKVSFLKIVKNHGISIINGFDEHMLDMEVIEHIKKYNPKIEI